MYPVQVVYDPWSGWPGFMFLFVLIPGAFMAGLFVWYNLDTILEHAHEWRMTRERRRLDKATAQYIEMLTRLTEQSAMRSQAQQAAVLLALQGLQSGLPLSAPAPEPMLQLMAPPTQAWSQPMPGQWIVEPVPVQQRQQPRTFNEALDHLLDSGDRAIQKWGGR